MAGRLRGRRADPMPTWSMQVRVGERRVVAYGHHFESPLNGALPTTQGAS
jgi:hypothetical protein